MYFFPYNDSTSSLPIRSWSYFPKVSAEVFHSGSFFVSHRGSVSSSEIQQLNSTELCWKISCSGEWELLLNKGEKKKKKPWHSPKTNTKQNKKNALSKKLKHTSNSLDYSKSVRENLVSGGRSQLGFFFFPWFLFLNSETRKFCTHLSWWTSWLIGFHPATVGGSLRKVFKTRGGSAREAGVRAVCAHFWTSVARLWYWTLRTGYYFICI